MESTSGKNKKILLIVGLVIIVAAIAVGTMLLSSKPASVTDTATPSPTPLTATVDSGAATPAAATYKDGTYNATGSYDSPGGPEQVMVQITLKSGTVSDSTVSTTGHTPTGQRYQSQFVSGYKSFVVGKKIDDIHLSRVSGSSLTSGGFNDALTQIKSQAKG